MRNLIGALTLLLAACTGTEVTFHDADGASTLGPAPPFFFVTVLPNDLTATTLANTPTETNLPSLPIQMGGQGSWMVIPRLAALTPWGGHIALKLWLERDAEGTPSDPGPVFANVQLEPLGPLWVTPELPLVVGAPCAMLGHEIHARAKVTGTGPTQNLDGRFRIAWNQTCP